jgi:hypothetical protein
MHSYLDENTDLQIKIPFLLATIVTGTLYAIMVSLTTYAACCADNSDMLRQKISWRVDPCCLCVGLSLLPIASLVIATVPGSIDELDSVTNALLHYSKTLVALFVGLVVALAAAHVRRRNSAEGERLWRAAKALMPWSNSTESDLADAAICGLFRLKHDQAVSGRNAHRLQWKRPGPREGNEVEGAFNLAEIAANACGNASL